jgi:hypothetical protein
MTYGSIYIIVATLLSQQETIYDQHLDLFREIVEEGAVTLAATANADGSQPSFTFEAGVGMPY